MSPSESDDQPEYVEYLDQEIGKLTTHKLVQQSSKGQEAFGNWIDLGTGLLSRTNFRLFVYKVHSII